MTRAEHIRSHHERRGLAAGEEAAAEGVPEDAGRGQERRPSGKARACDAMTYSIWDTSTPLSLSFGGVGHV